MNEKVNLLEKLLKARADFYGAGIKKTGENKFVGFLYYELHDILPKIAELSSQYRFICKVSFSADTAVLKIIDLDDPNQFLEFTSPMASANVKGAQDIQNMGAVQTYMRRYLYMMAFEVVDNDTFDGTMGKQPQNPPAKPQNPAPQNNAKPTQNTPQNGHNLPESERKEKAENMIRDILNTQNPDKLPYFNNGELKIEKELFDKSGIAEIEKQYFRLKSELEKRIKAFKPIPFADSDNFQDDIPQ